MKSKLLLTTLLTFTILVAACAPAPTPVSTPVIPVTGNTATSVATEAPTTTEAVTETPAATEATTETPGTQVSTLGTATAVTIMLSNEGTTPFLVDDQGRAVYLYTKDTQGTTTSACTDTECTSEWTPVLVTGTPTAGDGVDATLLGTITGADGQMQATYNGHPLYYFNDDTNPGDTKGQGMENEWYLVSATGDAIQP